MKINYYDVRETGTVLSVNLICDPALDEFTVTNTSRGEKAFEITARTKFICPQEISNMISHFFDTFKWVFFVLGIIIGPLELLIGNKIFRITVFLVI